MRHFVLSAAVSVLLACPVLAEDAVVNFGADDPEMSAAEAEAKASLPKFLIEVVGPDGYAIEGTAVKVSFPTVDPESSGMDTEVIWVSPWAMSQGQFRGLLANEPVALGDLRVGDVVDFRQDQIHDWSYFGEDGKLYGNYSTRVMLPHIPAEQAAEFNDLLSANPIPDYWQN